MLYALIAKDNPGMGDKRLATRPSHLDHLNGLGDKLRLAGATLNADGQPDGSIMVVEADTIEAATALFMADPFIKEGIFATTEIKPWRVAIDNMTTKS